MGECVEKGLFERGGEREGHGEGDVQGQRREEGTVEEVVNGKLRWWGGGGGGGGSGSSSYVGVEQVGQVAEFY